MPRGIKVALPGINALTDTDPANFSLYIDGTTDHILIKEKARGTESVEDAAADSIAHSLGYFPLAMAHVEISSGEFQWVYNAFGGSFNPFYAYVTTTNLVLGNSDTSARVFTYLIFYDQL